MDALSLLRFQILYVGMQLSREDILPEKEGVLSVHERLVFCSFT